MRTFRVAELEPVFAKVVDCVDDLFWTHCYMVFLMDQFCMKARYMTVAYAICSSVSRQVHKP